MTRSPSRVVLVHGATGGPWTFDDWLPLLHDVDVDVVVPDLQEGLDVAHASMTDYADAVVRAVGDARPAAVVGFSMGGLVAMLAATRVPLAGLAVVEPSVPAEVGGTDPGVVPRPGTYGVEEYGGNGGRHRPESALARAERYRGISVPRLTSPLLVVAGRDFGATRGSPVAESYHGELHVFPRLGHLDLVRDPEPVRVVLDWVRNRLAGGGTAR